MSSEYTEKEFRAMSTPELEGIRDARAAQARWNGRRSDPTGEYTERESKLDTVVALIDRIIAERA